MEFAKIIIAMKKGLKQPKCFCVSAAPEGISSEEIEELIWELVQFMESHPGMTIVTGSKGARGPNMSLNGIQHCRK